MVKFDRFSGLLLAFAVALSAAACQPPPIKKVHFVNSHQDAKAPDLAAHYVDFSFDYPANWTVDPDTGSPDAQNYVTVERKTPDGVMIESFGVGEFHGGDDPAAISALLSQFESQVSGMPGYRRIALGPTTVNGLAGQQLEFSLPQQHDGKTVTTFGRVIVLPGAQGPNGVMLAATGTDATGEIHSPDDLGVKGQMPVIFYTFQMASSPPG